MSRAIVFIGGDRRNIELAKLLKEDGFKVNTYSLYDKENDEWPRPDSIEEALKGANAVVAGIPCTKDGETLNAEEKISFTYLFNLMNENQTFFGGLINDKIGLLANKKGIKLYDFSKCRRVFSIKCNSDCGGCYRDCNKKDGYNIARF
jgi:dipicolinate synthase subunit A